MRALLLATHDALFHLHLLTYTSVQSGKFQVPKHNIDLIGHSSALPCFDIQLLISSVCCRPLEAIHIPSHGLLLFVIYSQNCYYHNFLMTANEELCPLKVSFCMLYFSKDFKVFSSLLPLSHFYTYYN